MGQAGDPLPSWTYYSPSSAPSVFDIVICRFPFEEEPEKIPTRRSPCLVKRIRVHESGKAAFITVAFGTSNLMGLKRLALDLIIQNAAEMQRHGLSMATRFDLSQKKTADLPWCKEWFPIPNGNLTPRIGSLDRETISRLIFAADNRKTNNVE